MGFHARTMGDWASTASPIVDAQCDNQKTSGNCFRWRPSCCVPPFRHTPRPRLASGSVLTRSLVCRSRLRRTSFRVALRAPHIATCIDCKPAEHTDFVSTSCRYCKHLGAMSKGCRHMFTLQTAPRSTERPPVTLTSISHDILPFNQASFAIKSSFPSTGHDDVIHTNRCIRHPCQPVSRQQAWD
jgi:hypothetical protein